MRYIIGEWMKTGTALAIAGALLLPVLMNEPTARAQVAAVTEQGYITINGKVEFASDDEFSLSHNGERIDVTMDEANDETIERLIDSNLIERGAYVTVTGLMTEEYGSPLISASSIRVYNN